MPKPAARKVVTPWLANCQLEKKPRRRGSCSASSAVALPNSPPAAKPCSSRARITRPGAHSPICAKVGATAISSVPHSISAIESVSAFLRPLASAYAPSTSEPMGRITKVTPKVPSVMSSETVSFSAGKKSLEMVTARKP